MKLRTLLCAGAVGMATIACGTEQDPSETVERALASAQLNDVDAEWEGTGRVLHIKGEVPTATDRSRAEAVAKESLGTKGQVVNEVTVEGTHTEIADDLDSGIETRVENLFENDATLLDFDVDAEVLNGVVTLTGEVQTEAQKNRVTDLARTIPGVKDVANAVTVKPPAR